MMMIGADRIDAIQYNFGGGSLDENTSTPPRVRRLFPETWLWESSQIGYADKTTTYNIVHVLHITSTTV